MSATSLHQPAVIAQPSGSARPPMHKSAVYEYSCLFTHDVRRKNTKRWQDGFLRFHLFNKRVMVYDQSRNYIGDTHFQDSGSDGLADGEELKLERGGVLVQVGEKLSVQETDLSDLLAKRAPKKAAEQEPTRQSVANDPNLVPSSQLQPRSSNIIQITPARSIGWKGRTQIPKFSPFEIKRSEAAVCADGGFEDARAAKRQRRDEDEHVPLRQILKMPNVSRGKLSMTTTSSAAVKVRTSNSRVSENNISRRNSKREFDRKVARNVLNDKDLVDLASSPEPLAHPDKQDQLHAPGVTRIPSSPPVSKTSYVPVFEEDFGGSSMTTNLAAPVVEKLEDQTRKTKPLRLATSAPRKRLYCQSMGVAMPPKDRSSKNPARASALIVSNTDKVSDAGSKDSWPDFKRLSSDDSLSPVDHDESFEESIEHPDGQPIRQEQTQIPVQSDDDAPPAMRNVRYGSTQLDVQLLAPSNLATGPPLATSKCNAEDKMLQPKPSTTVNPVTETTSPSPLRKTETPPRHKSRPFRRHNSDAPSIKTAAPTPRPSLKRSDTTSVLPSDSQRRDAAKVNTEFATSRPHSRRASVQALELASRDEDVGPWSREAWDLFGGCPEGKEAELGWKYDVAST